MKTSHLTRRMMLPALFLGLAGFAQAGQNQTRHHHDGGHHNRFRVSALATKIKSVIFVRTAVREGRSYKRLPMMKLSSHRRFASTQYRQGHYRYFATAKLHGRHVHVTVKKLKGHRKVGFGSTTAAIRGKTPPPQRQATYTISRYHPLTGKHIHTQRFNDRTAAMNWYNHNKKLWWIFVYSDFGRSPKNEYRGSKSVCTKMANGINANLFDGKRAKAMPPRITFKTSYK